MYSQEDLDIALNKYGCERFEHAYDCDWIAEIAYTIGYDISAAQARIIWEWWSDMYAAGWLTVIENEVETAINAFISGYIKEDEENI